MLAVGKTAVARYYFSSLKRVEFDENFNELMEIFKTGNDRETLCTIINRYIRDVHEVITLIPFNVH